MRHNKATFTTGFIEADGLHRIKGFLTVQWEGDTLVNQCGVESMEHLKYHKPFLGDCLEEVVDS